MDKINFGIVGAGWRAEFYLRIAKELPDRFCVSAMLVRDEAKGRSIEKKWGIKTYRSLDELLKSSNPFFLVVSVPPNVNPVILNDIADRGIPALSETPPAENVEDLIKLHKLSRSGAEIQVAEQYIYQPMHSACLNIIISGKLGIPTQAQVSVAHGYHGISLIRHMLGIKFEDATISTHTFTSPLIEGPGRKGPPVKETITNATQTIAYLDFGKKTGIYDFTGAQYFSWIRSPRVLIRGERGEINNSTVKYLVDFRTPVELELHRLDAGENGNLEGYYHKGILAGNEWVYRNPFIPARLTDDEIAVATSLTKMAEYVNCKGEQGFYSLAMASQDRYLDLMINKAVETGEKVKTSPQPWTG